MNHSFVCKWSEFVIENVRQALEVLGEGIATACYDYNVAQLLAPSEAFVSTSVDSGTTDVTLLPLMTCQKIYILFDS